MTTTPFGALVVSTKADVWCVSNFSGFAKSASDADDVQAELRHTLTIPGSPDLQHVTMSVDATVCFVADAGNRCIWTIHNSKLCHQVATPMFAPSGLCVWNSLLLVSSPQHHALFSADVEVLLSEDASGVRWTCVAGADHEPERVDGMLGNVRLRSPTGLATAGRSVFIADTGNRSVRLITFCAPMKKLLENMRKLTAAYGLLRGQDTVHNATCLRGTLRLVCEVDKYLQDWEIYASTRVGKPRRSLNGPQGIVSRQVRRAVQMAVVSLGAISRLLSLRTSEAHLLDTLNPAAFTTRNCEVFFSIIMRNLATAPTVSEYALRRARVVAEAQKRLGTTSFSYAGPRRAHYSDETKFARPRVVHEVELVALRKAARQEVPPLPIATTTAIRYFERHFGRGVSQLRVRAGTKASLGSKPDATWFFAKAAVGAADFSSAQPPALSDTSSAASHAVTAVSILFREGCYLALKTGKKAGTPFFLCRTADNILGHHHQQAGPQFDTHTFSGQWLESEDYVAFELGSVFSDMDPCSIVCEVELDWEDDGSLGVLRDSAHAEILSVLNPQPTTSDSSAESSSNSEDEDQPTREVVPKRSHAHLRASATKLQVVPTRTQVATRGNAARTRARTRASKP